jgi:hypothetical protein
MSPRRKKAEVVGDAPEAVMPLEDEAPVDLSGVQDPTPVDVPDSEDAVQSTSAAPEVEVTTAMVKLVYTGNADVVRYAPYEFRPGKPVEVPSVIAEELLTFPFERFVAKE